MKYYDVSMPITDGMLSWPSDPDFKLKSFKTIAESGSNVQVINGSTHFGTHIDAPKHFLPAGSGVDTLSFDTLLGPAEVLDLTDIPGLEITPADLTILPKGVKRVLLKTKNSVDRLLQQPFTEEYVGLSGDAAEWLAKQGIKLVGIDYLSIQRRSKSARPHTALLRKKVVIIEGLWLADVPAGTYELLALPLRIKDGDGAPARVLLKK